MLSADRIDAFVLNKELKDNVPKCKANLDELSKLAKQSRCFHSFSSDEKYARLKFIRKDEKNDFEAGFGVDNASGLIIYPYGRHNNIL